MLKDLLIVCFGQPQCATVPLAFCTVAPVFTWLAVPGIPTRRRAIRLTPWAELTSFTPKSYKDGSRSARDIILESVTRTYFRCLTLQVHTRHSHARTSRQSDMEIASARPMERFSHNQAFDNSYNFGSAGTLLQFTTGTGADRPSCMFSFDNLNHASLSSTSATLKSPKLLKENTISLSSFTCKRKLDFNHLTLANSIQLHNENVNNNNNLNSINNNNNNNSSQIDANYSSRSVEKSSQLQQSNSSPSMRQRHHQQQQNSHRRNGQHQNQVKPVFTAVQRRNERERNRVKLINMTFATLREHLPSGTKGNRSKKMSKVETLKAAIEYIRYLRQLVDEHDAVNAVLDSSVLTPVLTSANVLTSSSLSPATSMSSPNPSSCSDSSCEGISVDEDDLLDFSNWF
ncbi:protein kinase 4-like [Liolophura sinensis]|uniref:protein kinase 4-like n=1 Tax=Liolophura sinensis TaxID=3198878 RepID=UPI00315925BF